MPLCAGVGRRFRESQLVDGLDAHRLAHLHQLDFVVGGRDVVFAHGVVGELVPHEDAAQIGMAVEDDAVEVEGLALLKLRAAPDRGERGNMDLVGAVLGAQAQNYRAVLLLHREQVVDGFEIAGDFGFSGFFDFCLHSVDELLDFHLFGQFRCRASRRRSCWNRNRGAVRGGRGGSVRCRRHVRSRCSRECCAEGLPLGTMVTTAAGNAGFNRRFDLVNRHRRASLTPVIGSLSADCLPRRLR